MKFTKVKAYTIITLTELLIIKQHTSIKKFTFANIIEIEGD